MLLGFVPKDLVSSESMAVWIWQGFDGPALRATMDSSSGSISLKATTRSTHMSSSLLARPIQVLGGRGRIRTRDLRLRRPTHYPAVLHAQRCQNAPMMEVTVVELLQKHATFAHLDPP